MGSAIWIVTIYNNNISIINMSLLKQERVSNMILDIPECLGHRVWIRNETRIEEDFVKRDAWVNLLKSPTPDNFDHNLLPLWPKINY